MTDGEAMPNMPADIGVLPTEWPVSRIGDLFEIQQGKALSPRAKQGVSPKPFLRTSNVLWGRIDLSAIDEMDFSDDEAARLALQPGDLLVCEGGDVGRSAVWSGELASCFYQNHIHRLRKRRDDVEPRFFMFWIQAAFTIFGLYGGQANRTTIPNLSKARLANFPVPHPSLPEQRAIVGVLSAVRRAIEATVAVIEATQLLKRSIMRHLFTYGPVPIDQADQVPLKGTAIGPVPEGWEVARFGDVIDIVSGQVDPREEPYCGMVHIGPEDVEQGTGRILAPKTAAELKLRSGKYLFTPDHVIYSKIRPYLRKAVLPSITGVCSADMYPLRPKEGILLRGYLYHTLLSDTFTQQAVSHQARTGIPKINRIQLNSVSIPVPPREVQGAIASVVGSLDAKRNAEIARKATIEALFRSLLHHLMTGRIRIAWADHEPA